jgi:hypothetical protein
MALKNRTGNAPNLTMVRKFRVNPNRTYLGAPVIANARKCLKAKRWLTLALIDRRVGYEASKPSFLRPATMDRKMRADLHQRRSRLAPRSGSTGAVEFFNVLTSEELLQATEALRPEHRERPYAPTVTLSMFMRQTLGADGSCQWHLAITDRRNDCHDPIMH